MEISIKVKYSILLNIEKINNNDFTEREIKELLIDVREYIPKSSLLLEFANFIAHPLRNQGICHAEIDYLYCNFKNLNSKTKLNQNRIPTGIYNTLIKYGIDKKVDENKLTEKFNLNKQKLNSLLNKNYKVDKWFATLIKPNNLKIIKEQEIMLEALRFVFSKFSNNTVFTQSELINDFIIGIEGVLQILNINKNIIDKWNLKSNDIIICLMALIHDSSLLFYDKEIGKIYLDKFKNDFDGDNFYYLNAKFIIKHEKGEGTFCFPISKSTIKCEDYILNYYPDLEINQNVLTKRVNQKLTLVKIPNFTQ